RYTDYLLKYDYIVGDISYEKLRLRGFYEDYRKGIPVDMKISNLEDYLVEYCSFGCQYFVFERIEKVESDPESYFKKKKTKQPNHTKQSKKRTNKRNNKNQNKQNKQNKQRKQRSKTKKVRKKQKEQKNIQVKKKETHQKTRKSGTDNKQQS